jgi:hypothetical protein
MENEMALRAKEASWMPLKMCFVRNGSTGCGSFRLAAKAVMTIGDRKLGKIHRSFYVDMVLSFPCVEPRPIFYSRSKELVAAFIHYFRMESGGSFRNNADFLPINHAST